MNYELRTTNYELFLAIHATGAQLGLAIAHSNGDRRSQTWTVGRNLDHQLHSQLIEFVKPHAWQDFSAIAVAKGPGSFTSTRIGVVTARTLAQQLEIPLFAISNLAVVARAQASASPIAVQQAARREQIFAALYQQTETGLQTLLPDTATTRAAWQEQLDTWGGEYQSIEAPEDLADTVTHLLDLAAERWQTGERPHWSEAIPFYGQHPVG